MAPTKTEQEKLEAFKTVHLGREQIEIIIGRKLTKKEWKLFIKDYHPIFTSIAKQAANVATNKDYLKPNYKDIFRNIADQEIKRQYGINAAKPVHNNKNALKDIATQAAKVARRKNKTDHESCDQYHVVKSLLKSSKDESLFGSSKDEFQIVKLSQYYSSKYKTNVSTWKITGSINLFNIHT